MNLRARIKRLENQQKTDAEPSFAEALAIYEAMWEWLEERGYEDPDQAIAAGETGPAGLEELLREQAQVFRREKEFRAWEKRGFGDPRPDGF